MKALSCRWGDQLRLAGERLPVASRTVDPTAFSEAVTGPRGIEVVDPSPVFIDTAVRDRLVDGPRRPVLAVTAEPDLSPARILGTRQIPGGLSRHSSPLREFGHTGDAAPHLAAVAA
jgi:hypothetical protein